MDILEEWQSIVNPQAKGDILSTPEPDWRNGELSSGDDEMIEGEFIFIPHRKYRGRVNDDFNGNSISGKLTSGYDNPEYWREKYFG